MASHPDLSLTIVFGCLATVLAFAGVIVACVQCRSRNRTVDNTESTPSTLEAALPLTPIAPNGREQNFGTPGSAPESNVVEHYSTPSNADATQASDDGGFIEITCGSVRSTGLA